MYVLRESACSQRMKKERREDIKASLEFHLSRFVMVQDEERAGIGEI